MTTYFVSDTHWGHRNIPFYCTKRAELWGTQDVKDLVRLTALGKISKDELKTAIQDLSTSIEETIQRMSEGLIQNWNSRVVPEDEVYHIGDFMMGSASRWESILSRLNGKIHLVAGNHDRKFRKQQYVIDRMEWIKDYHQLYIKDPTAENGKNQLIVLQHFAPYVWEDSHRGSWALSGHSHGSLDKWHRDRLSLDVGVDAEHTNYFPISYEEVRAAMKKKSINFVDHHGKDTNP
jgi:calcineurin-like phosphoesterase family protein